MKLKVITTLAIVLMVPVFPVLAQSKGLTVRPLAEVRADAIWGAHEGAKDQISEGASGRKYDIMKCYAMTPSPAYRCVALDLSGYVMDSGMAAQLSMPFTDDYFAPNTARNRMLAQYLAANIGPEDAMREIRYMQGIIDKTMATDLAKENKTAK